MHVFWSLLPLAPVGGVPAGLPHHAPPRRIVAGIASAPAVASTASARLSVEFMRAHSVATDTASLATKCPTSGFSEPADSVWLAFIRSWRRVADPPRSAKGISRIGRAVRRSTGRSPRMVLAVVRCHFRCSRRMCPSTARSPRIHRVLAPLSQLLPRQFHHRTCSGHQSPNQPLHANSRPALAWSRHRSALACQCSSGRLSVSFVFGDSASSNASNHSSKRPPVRSSAHGATSPFRCSP